MRSAERAGRRPGRRRGQGVFSNPGPDTGDRLRRLIALMVRYATNDRVTPKSSDIAFDRSRGETIVLEKVPPSQDIPEADD